MEKILFFGYYFYPSNEIGAVRISEIVKRLALNYDVTVVVDHPEGDEVRIDGVHYWYINEAFATCNGRPSKKKKSSAVRRHLGLCRQSIRNIRSSYRYLKKFIRLYNDSGIDFRYVISSYGPLSNHLCGLYIKKANPNIKWIADFRDPMDAPIIPRIFLPFMRRRQKRVCREADEIVCVSNGYFNKIIPPKYRNKGHVIYNGFNRALENDSLPQRFSFLYVGSMYSGTRKFSPLFDAIRKLVAQVPEAKEDLEIRYIGRDNELFETQCKKAGVDMYYRDLGCMPRESCVKNELESYFLIMSTWNLKNYQGVIPGKLFEYLACGRKIISVCTGNVPNSEVGGILSDLKRGISIEVNYSSNDVFEYLKKEYLSWKTGNYHIENTDILRFSYDAIAQEYRQLLAE